MTIVQNREAQAVVPRTIVQNREAQAVDRFANVEKGASQAVEQNHDRKPGKLGRGNRLHF